MFLVAAGDPTKTGVEYVLYVQHCTLVLVTSMLTLYMYIYIAFFNTYTCTYSIMHPYHLTFGRHLHEPTPTG